jgi:L1 cell adhesion molecule like protein
LGIALKNENKIDEMCDIMEDLHKYVPSLPINEQIVLPNGEKYELCDTDLWQIVFGGDQLTVVRARAAASIRDDHNTSKDKLNGLIPVIEDGHARVTLLKVI